MRRLVFGLLLLASPASAQVICVGEGCAGGSSSLESGVTPVTGCDGRIIYGVDGVLTCEAALGYVQATDTLSVSAIDNGASALNLNKAAGAPGRVSFGNSGAERSYFSMSEAAGWVHNDAVRMYFGDGFQGGLLENSTVQTPDSFTLMLGTTSRSLVVAEIGDRGFDFAHAQQTNPTVFIHSAAQSTTQWLSLTHNGTNAQIAAGTGTIHFSSAGGLDISGPQTLQGNTQLYTDIEAYIGTGGTDADNSVSRQSAGTPDQYVLGTGTTANAWLVAESQDRAFDFAHPVQANPTIFVHSRNQSTNEFVGVTHTGKGAVLNNPGTVALTEAGGAELVATITTATTEMTGGEMSYVVRIADSAGSPDYAVRAGRLSFQMTNSAGVTVCTGAVTDETNDGSSIAQGGTSKTLTYAITYTEGANTCLINFNIDSDMVTATSASITYTLILNGPGTVS